LTGQVKQSRVQMPMKKQMRRQHAEHGHGRSHSSPEWHQKPDAALIVSFWTQFAFRPVRSRLWVKEKLGQSEPVRTSGFEVEVGHIGGGPASIPKPLIWGARGIESPLARNTVNGFLERELRSPRAVALPAPRNAFGGREGPLAHLMGCAEHKLLAQLALWH